MKEKYVSLLIQRLMQQSSYGVIEINGNNRIPTIWCAKKQEYNKEVYILFLDSKSINYINEYKNIILHNTRMSGIAVEIIKVIAIESNRDNWNEFNPYLNGGEENTLIIDVNDNAIAFSNIQDEGINTEIKSAIIRMEAEKRNTNINRTSKITNVLIGINVLVYIISAYLSVKYGGSPIDSKPEVLYIMGANVNFSMMQGQYYRLFTSMFLHGGLIHLAANMYALYAIGTLVNRIYGNYKYMLIYFIGGLCSSLLSSMFLDTIAIGASGAIFALLGATLVFAFKFKSRVGKEFLRNILSVIFINAAIGLTLPNIDNFGHLGGLLGGIVISAIFIEKIGKERRY